MKKKTYSPETSDCDDLNEEEIEEEIYSEKKLDKPKIDIVSSHNDIMELVEEFKESDNKKKKHKLLPWVEEFRPTKLKYIIDHDEHISMLKTMINEKKLPNLLLSGPPGTGKTSTIMACAKKMYKENYSLMVLDINASEERGIDVVRSKIRNFIMTEGIQSDEKNHLFKLVILDEADAMTNDAQIMLIKIMEKYMKNVRFCLMCNYIKKINPAIQSRCVLFKFSPLREECIKQKILEISTKYNFEVTEDGIETLINIANGDMRKVINTLQATNMAFVKVNMENINKCIGYPTPQELNDINKMLINNDIKYCYEKIGAIIKNNGYSLLGIVRDLFKKYFNEIINNPDYNNDKIETFISNLRELEINLTMYQTEEIQLAGMISIFKQL